MDEPLPLKQVPLPPGFGSARGSEHEVWFVQGESHVIKATHAGEFGRVFGPKQFASLPEYLARVALTNEVFGLDWEILGVHGEGRRLRVVSRQPVIRGRAATLAEIREFMVCRGFVLHRTRFGDAWYRKDDNLLVSDAEPNNVLATDNGLVPIDVLVCRPSNELQSQSGIVR